MFAKGLRLQSSKSPMFTEVLTGLRLPGGIYPFPPNLAHNHNRNPNLPVSPPSLPVLLIIIDRNLPLCFLCYLLFKFHPRNKAISPSVCSVTSAASCSNSIQCHVGQAFRLKN